MFYSISYYDAQRNFKCVDSYTFQKAQKALIRATLHLERNADTLRRADIIYQGKNVHKVVRSVAVLNQSPKHQ